jgi:DNA replication and repair protein RecF
MLILNRLSIFNLRNLSKVDVTLGSRLNFLVGGNGAGKTSFLEAAFLLGRGRSFRGGGNRQLVGPDSGEVGVQGEFLVGSPVRVAVRIVAGNTVVHRNGNTVSRLSELAKEVVFGCIDERVGDLVVGPPALRRSFLDWGLFHVEPGYEGIAREFLTVKRHVRALVTDAASEYSRYWIEKYAALAAQISRLRSGYAGRVQEALDFYLSGFPQLQGTAIRYEQGWVGDSDALQLSLQRDRAGIHSENQNIPGPHRGELRFQSDQGPARFALSRGQQKLLSICLVLASARVQGADKRTAVLLVDDLASELDSAALARCMELIAGSGMQCLLTVREHDSVGTSEWKNVSGCRMFHVEQGAVTPL